MIHHVSLTEDEKILVSSGSESEILVWDFKMMRPIYKETTDNADIVYKARMVEGTDYILTSQSNGQLKVYDILKFNLVAETPVTHTEAWAMALDWNQPQLMHNIYQGSLDGTVTEWRFNRKEAKFTQGYSKWSHLDAVRDIVVYPKYDLMISGSRVSALITINFMCLERRDQDLERQKLRVLLLADPPHRGGGPDRHLPRRDVADPGHVLVGPNDQLLSDSGEVVLRGDG